MKLSEWNLLCLGRNYSLSQDRWTPPCMHSWSHDSHGRGVISSYSQALGKIFRELLDRESFMPVGCVDSPSMAIMTVQSSQFMESLVPRMK